MTNYEEISEQIIKRICECGGEAYLVGGAVRDEFLDTLPSDFDIVTNFLPDKLSKIFPDKKVKTFGVSFLVTSIDGIDVSTYRTDKNFLPGRQNCITEATKTLYEDLKRRDFTFNAIAICPYTGEVIDPFGGKRDLNRRIVKFVGIPEKRIHEDYLRMIRAARFACLIEGILDPAAFEAIYNNRGLVSKISPERIRMELLKVMKYKNPSIFFDILHQTGILEIILPEFESLYGHLGGKFHGETLDHHSKIAGDSLSAKDPLLRLIGYFHDIGKPVVFNGESFIDHEKVGSDIIEMIFKRFKFTSNETEKAKGLVALHMRSFNSLPTGKSIRKLIKALSDHNVSFKDWLKLKTADNKANLRKPPYTKEEIKSFCLRVYNSKKLTTSGGFKVTDLKINGNDIMEILDINPGKEVGEILNDLLNQVIDNPELNKKETLIELVKRR